MNKYNIGGSCMGHNTICGPVLIFRSRDDFLLMTSDIKGVYFLTVDYGSCVWSVWLMGLNTIYPSYDFI